MSRPADSKRLMEERTLLDVAVIIENMFENPIREAISDSVLFGYYADVTRETRNHIKYPVAQSVVAQIRWAFS